MADTILVAYSQRLQETVDRVMGPNSLSVNQGRRERGHNSLANKEIAAGGGGGVTETIINIELYTQQWIIDIDAGTCTCTGGYIVVNNTVLINLAGSVVNFSAANNNEVLVCQINPDFRVQWVWGASGASGVIAAKPSIVCFLLSLGTNIQLKINARFYEYVTYIATNPVIGV